MEVFRTESWLGREMGQELGGSGACATVALFLEFLRFLLSFDFTLCVFVFVCVTCNV